MEFEIIDIDKIHIILKDNSNNTYKLNLKINGVDIKIYDKIIIHEDLFEDLLNSFNTFGMLDSKYGFDIDNISNEELKYQIIKLISDEKEIYLKKLYG